MPIFKSQAENCPTATVTVSLSEVPPTSTISSSLTLVPPKYNFPQYVDCYVPDWKSPSFYTLDSHSDPFTSTDNEACDWLTNGPSVGDFKTGKYKNWSGPTAAAVQLGHLNACISCAVTLPTDGQEYDNCKKGTPSILNTVIWDTKEGWNDYSLDGPSLRPGKQSWLSSRCDYGQTDFGWYMNTNNQGAIDHEDTYDIIPTDSNLYNDNIL